jgi:hypothetical protein
VYSSVLITLGALGGVAGFFGGVLGGTGLLAGGPEQLGSGGDFLCTGGGCLVGCGALLGGAAIGGIWWPGPPGEEQLRHAVSIERPGEEPDVHYIDAQAY